MARQNRVGVRVVGVSLETSPPTYAAIPVRAAPTGGQAVAAIDPPGPREQFKSMPGFLPTDVGTGATAQPAGLGLAGSPHPKPLEGAQEGLIF